MGLGQNLRDLYASLEDGYYSLLDKLSNHLPVYSIVDPIDRVVPSFAVLLVVLAALIGWLVLGGLNMPFAGNTVAAQIAVEDISGNKLPNIPVQAQFNGQTRIEETDAQGLVSFDIPQQSSVTFSIELEGFESVSETVAITDAAVARRLVLTRIETSRTRVIQFSDATGRAIRGERISVRLACSNPAVVLTPTEYQSDTEGRIELLEPPQCGTLAGSVVGPGEYAAQSFSLSQSQTVIKLQAADVALGSVRVRIADASDNLLSALDGTVSLFSEAGSILQTLPIDNGFARFQNIEIGTYYVSAQDESGLYGARISETFEVTQNHLTTITLVLSRNVAQNLLVRVRNENAQPLENATVTLSNPQTGNEEFFAQTDEDGETRFALFESHSWQVQARRDGYHPDSQTVSASQTAVTLELEEIAVPTTGIVEVTVKDEKGKPVENARVRLRWREELTFAPYAEKSSDINGQVVWRGVKPGSDVFAYAEKFPAAGSSDPFVVVIGDNNVTLNMEVGDTTVTVRALTEDNELIPSSTAVFFDASGERLGEIPLSNGQSSINLKSDKRIFVVVQNPQYFSYQTETFQLFKGKQLRIDAPLPARLISGGPRVLLSGVFDESGREVEQMEAGNNYLVKLQLKVPEDAAYSEVGVHFRVGNQKLLENDQIVIKSVNVANAAVVRGMTYHPSQGTVIDLNPANLTSGDSKWANVTLSNPQARVYAMTFEVRIKTATAFNTPIPMFYRAWATTVQSGSARIIRDPQDIELGESVSIVAKHPLYSNAYPITQYFEGAGSDCDDYFCYSNIRFFDNNQGLYLAQPFELIVGQDYNFSFEVTNQSPINFSGARFRVLVLSDGEESDAIELKNYRIRTASAETVTGSGGSVIETGVGSLVVNAGLSGNLFISPHTPVPGSILIQTIFQGEIVSEKELFFESIAAREMFLSLEPDPIPAFLETLAVVHAREADNDPVPEATITLTRETTGTAQTSQQSQTNTLGNAEFVIVASSPGTRIIVNAAKPNYSALPLVRIVDENVLVFEPDEIAFSLKTATKPEDIVEVLVGNQTAIDLRFSRLRLVGDFAGILDVTRIQAHLDSLVGTTIPANSFNKTIDLKAFVSPTARIFQPETITATLAIEAVDEQLSQVWVFAIPVQIGVVIDGVPENKECLSVDQPVWNAASQESSLTHTFTVTNNCRLEGKAIALSDFSARINWSGNAIGNVELTLTDAQNPNNSITQVLREDSDLAFFDVMNKDGAYFGSLEFVPRTNAGGEEAAFTVSFLAKTPGEGGLQEVTTKNPIEAQLLVTSLQFCLQYETTTGQSRRISEFPQRTNADNGTASANLAGIAGSTAYLQGAFDQTVTEVVIGTENEARVTIDSSQCGAMNLDIILCMGDDYCRGGTAEGGITLSPIQFSLSPRKTVQEVKVSRQEIPGIYGLTVFARSSGRAFSKVATLDVLVDPPQDEYFSLGKYLFFIKGLGTQDSTTLENDNFVTTTTVDAPASMWARRNRPDSPNFMSAMLPLMGAALVPQMIPALTGSLQGSHDAARDLAKVKDEALKKARDSAKESAKQAGDISESFSESFDDGGVIDDKLANLSDLTSKEGLSGITEACQSLEALQECSRTCGVGISSGLLDQCNSLKNQIKTSLTAQLEDPQKVINNLSDAKESFQKIGTQTQQISTNMPTARFKKGSDFSSVSSATAQSLDPLCNTTIPNQIETLQGTAEKLTNVTDQLGQMQESFDTMLEDDIGAFMQDIDTGVNCPQCATAQASAKQAVQKAFEDHINAAKEELTNLQDYIQNDFGLDSPAYTDTLDSLNAAKTDCLAAKTAMDEKSSATRVVSEHASGSNSGALTNVLSQGAQMGLMAAAMGSLFPSDSSEDRDDERVQQIQQVFAIDLLKDTKSISSSLEGVEARLDTENVKVTGRNDLENQKIGVVFENLGLSQDEPAYGIVEIRTNEHVFEEVTRVPFNLPEFLQFSGWNLGQLFGQHRDYYQKFHLKFVSKDTLLELPPIAPTAFSCTQGTMTGATGTDALPRIKLRWNWTDITLNTCDASNPDYSYCDATQFSIMMTKRLQALRDFLELNADLPCPSNWLEEQVQAELDPFNQFLVELDLDAFNTRNFASEGCWLPKTTDLFDNKSALEFYVDDSDQVRWTAEIPSAQALHDLLFFDAYLIADGYSQDFQSDFAHYFTNIAFLDTPSYFRSDPAGKNWNKYFEQSKVDITQKFTGAKLLPTSGLYRVETVVDFPQDSWQFFESDGTPLAAIQIDLLALRQTGLNSPFYYIPFNGAVGIEGATLNRQGYGVSYRIQDDGVWIAREGNIRTFEDAGSNAIQSVGVSSSAAFDSLNAFASQRGFLLDITNESQSEKTFRLTPSLATPVMIKVTQPATFESFGAFYTIRNNGVPQNAGSTAAYWTGAGACLDFTGSLVAERFDTTPDRKARADDRILQWPLAYGISWPQAATGGDVYLKTVFYTPVNSAFSIHAASENVTFQTSDQSWADGVSLTGIRSMLFNRQGTTATDNIAALDDLFALVEQQVVCVTNTGVRTSFWWNPKTILEYTGETGTSLSEFEATLVSGRTCH